MRKRNFIHFNLFPFSEEDADVEWQESWIEKQKGIIITVISGRLPARPITRTGRLLHTAKKKVNGLPAPVDNPIFNFLVAKT